ncbi:MAG: 16S rRNA (guanine(527)-N(7))-methyltransferase RsmG [Acidobacteriaceae bacterium]
MDATRIADQLQPFLGDEVLAEYQLTSISIYIDLLLRWNARMNLTAVRDPEQIVQRHFGESLFAARNLLSRDSTETVVDVGSGAGFPGIPLRLYAPGIQLTLIEAHGKKATFLREVCRALKFTNVNVISERAEDWGGTANLVTLRAVEKFDQVLNSAAALVAPGGRMGILLGARQASDVETLVPGSWSGSVPIPESRERVLRIWQKP